MPTLWLPIAFTADCGLRVDGLLSLFARGQSGNDTSGHDGSRSLCDTCNAHTGSMWLGYMKHSRCTHVISRLRRHQSDVRGHVYQIVHSP